MADMRLVASSNPFQKEKKKKIQRTERLIYAFSPKKRLKTGLVNAEAREVMTSWAVHGASLHRINLPLKDSTHMERTSPSDRSPVAQATVFVVTTEKVGWVRSRSGAQVLSKENSLL